MNVAFFKTFDPVAEPHPDELAANAVERGDPTKGVADCDVLHIGLQALKGVNADEVAIHQALCRAGLTFIQIEKRLDSILRAAGGAYAQIAQNLRNREMH